MSENKKAGLLHASERDGVDYRKAPLLQLIAGMSGSGTMIVLYLILGFATLIAPEGYGIPTAVARRHPDRDPMGGRSVRCRCRRNI